MSDADVWADPILLQRITLFSSIGVMEYLGNDPAVTNLHRGDHATIELGFGADRKKYSAAVKSRYRLRNGKIRVRFTDVREYMEVP